MSSNAEALRKIRELVVGKPLAEVEEKAKAAGWSLRVMRKNGKNCMGSYVHNPGRINVAVVDERVTEVISLG